MKTGRETARRVLGPAIVTAAALALLAPASAVALESCQDSPPATVLEDGYGILESVAADSQGRIYFTDTENNRLMRKAPGAPSEPFATGIADGGGIALEPDGDLLVGYGDSIANGLTGLINPQAGIVEVDSVTGAVSPYATGTQMSNGIARAPDGTVFASNDVGLGIDRIEAGSHAVTLNWATLFSPNGLVVDSTGTYLYAAQTFQPPAISRIELANPSNVATVFNGPVPDVAAALDGMTRDENDILYVAANFIGEVWRVNPADGSACALARGLTNPGEAGLTGPSAVALSGGDLYVVTFGGRVIRLGGVTAATPPPAAIPGDVVYNGKPKQCKKKKKKAKKKRKACKKKKKKRKRR